MVGIASRWRHLSLHHLKLFFSWVCRALLGTEMIMHLCRCMCLKMQMLQCKIDPLKIPLPRFHSRRSFLNATPSQNYSIGTLALCRQHAPTLRQPMRAFSSELLVRFSREITRFSAQAHLLLQLLKIKNALMISCSLTHCIYMTKSAMRCHASAVILIQKLGTPLGLWINATKCTL